MEKTSDLDEILDLAERLPPDDQDLLLKRLVQRIGRQAEPAVSSPRRSLRGLWKGLDVFDSDIDEARRAMWADSPRADL